MQDIEAIHERIESNRAAFVDSMITDQEAFYDVRANVYDEQNEIPSRIQRREIVYAIYHSILPDLLPKQITYLDFGCGTGSTTNEFLAGLNKYSQIAKGYAVDISSGMVKLAGQNLPNFKVIHGGVDKLDFNNKFDLVTAFFHVLCHLADEELELFFQNVSKSLKPSGILCFEVIKQLEVGEGSYTQSDKDKNRKYLAYHSEKKDGNIILDTQGQPMIGTDRMFESNEIIKMAQGHGFRVVDIREARMPHPDDNVKSFKELVVVLQKI